MVCIARNDMRQTYGASVSAPSSSLLRFLRHQFQETCFFTSNSGLAVCHHSPRRPTPVFLRRHDFDRYRISARHFTSSQHNHATVESSIFNFGFLRQSPKQGTWHQPTTPLRSTQDALQPYISQDKQASYSQAYTSSQPFLKRFWQSNRRKPESALRPDDLPPLPTFLNDPNGSVLGQSKIGKASNELKLRCTEINQDGDVTLVSGEFRKSELIAKYGLLPRDLRKIDSALLPHILVRPSAILINLLHLRVLIKHNRVLVLDAYGTTDSQMQSQFMYDLSGKLHQKDGSRQAGGLPYEFRAMEAVLISVTSGLEQEYEVVSEPVVRVLKDLEEDIDRDKLRHLLIYSKKLGTFEQKARLVRDAIDKLLDADDDLAAMYLSERAHGKRREEEDHTEVEMLLESYHKVCDEIVQVSENLVSNIRNTEEIVKAILDANRNSLMLLEIKFSIGTLGIGTGAMIVGMYGMNLKNFMEESHMGFLGVTGSSIVAAIVVVAIGLQKLRRVQRVRMWGERGLGTRGSWNQIEPASVRPGIRDRNRPWLSREGDTAGVGELTDSSSSSSSGSDGRSSGWSSGAVKGSHELPRAGGSAVPSVPPPVMLGKRKRSWSSGGREKDISGGGSLMGEQ